ncbi:hypothetical protein QC761_0111620 [Podospora bellae-mahoneyi]|uniref:Uncharacterized protein n=1 Tax=Podospora bellae-mahoneyi TaxID=2093777 RepID=A0ABR0F6W8_9PEZI|nr:hypothetical protein QC761_0111620 [Podospora bellae-mahoneyi]
MSLSRADGPFQVGGIVTYTKRRGVSSAVGTLVILWEGCMQAGLEWKSLHSLRFGVSARVCP